MKWLILLLALAMIVGCRSESTSRQADASAGGKRFLELCSILRGTGHIVPDLLGCSREELAIFEEYYSQPIPEELVTFLSATLPDEELDIGVCKTLGPKGLLEMHMERPQFQGQFQFGLFALGWWTGDTDGDGWFYDIETGHVLSLPISHVGGASRRDSLDAAYREFGSFQEWVAFLFEECKERGWIQDGR
jgi:hypothetical protein